MGDKSKLHLWSLGLSIIYCSIGAFMSFNYWTDLNHKDIPVLSSVFLPSNLITADSIYVNGSITFAMLWHLILLLIVWALFYLVFKMVRILWLMR